MDAAAIAEERDAAEADLAKARPFLDEANEAIDRISPSDLVELKSLHKPSDIIKLVFDCVLLLTKARINRVTPVPMEFGMGRSKRSVEFMADSYSLAKVSAAVRRGAPLSRTITEETVCVA